MMFVANANVIVQSCVVFVVRKSTMFSFQSDGLLGEKILFQKQLKNTKKKLIWAFEKISKANSHEICFKMQEYIRLTTDCPSKRLAYSRLKFGP